MKKSHVRGAAVRTGGALALVATLALTGCASTAETQASGDDEGTPTRVNEELRALLPQDVLDSGVILVGGDFASPPLLAADPADASKPIGIAPELTAEMGEVLGVTFEWQATEFPGQVPAIQSDALHLVMGQIGVTAEREEEVLDLVPFYRDQFGVLSQPNSGLEIAGFVDLCGLSIGVPTGSFYAAAMPQVNEEYCDANGFPDVDMREFSGNDSAATAVVSNQIDGSILTFGEASGFVEANSSDFEVHQLPVDETSLMYADLIGIGISKNNEGISNAVAGALQWLAEEGTYQDITKDGALSSDELVVNLLTGTPPGETVK